MNTQVVTTISFAERGFMAGSPNQDSVRKVYNSQAAFGEHLCKAVYAW